MGDEEAATWLIQSGQVSGLETAADMLEAGLARRSDPRLRLSVEEIVEVSIKTMRAEAAKLRAKLEATEARR